MIRCAPYCQHFMTLVFNNRGYIIGIICHAISWKLMLLCFGRQRWLEYVFVYMCRSLFRFFMLQKYKKYFINICKIYIPSCKTYLLRPADLTACDHCDETPYFYRALQSWRTALPDSPLHHLPHYAHALVEVDFHEVGVAFW